MNTKHLKEDEYLLYQQKIKGNKNIQSSDLELFFRQRPNRKILGLPIMPYLSAYYLGKPESYQARATRKKQKANQWFDKKKARKPDKETKWKRRLDKKLAKAELLYNEGPSIRRSFGEAPTIADDQALEDTRVQMTNFISKKGYFENEVKLVKRKKGKRSFLEYSIDEGKPTQVEWINYSFSDSTLKSLIENRPLKRPIVQKGMVYDEYAIRDEIESIDKKLKNSGYFRFRKQYITILVNDTLGQQKVGLSFNVIPPLNSNASRRYKISAVNFIEDASIESDLAKRDTNSYQGVKYIHFKSFVKPKQLNQKVKLYPNQFYSQDNTIKTQRNLANLNVYKYTNIRYDSAKQGFQAYIYTTPLPKYSTSFEVGAAVTQWLPGPFGSLSFRTRNVFGGAEMLDINLKGKIEAQTSFASETNFYQSADLGISTGLTFPNIAFPSPFRFRFNDQNPKTSVVAGYIYSSRPEYARHNANAHLRYAVSPKTSTTWALKFLDFTMVTTDVRDPRFSQYLLDLRDNGNNLIYSFGNSVVTSMSVDYVYNDFKLNRNKEAKYYNAFFESGGTVWNFFEGTTTEPNDTILGLQYYKFLKGSFDYRKYFPTTRYSLAAFRITGGLSYPYGANRAMPYEKYFFAGGSNTIRAWKPRRLGPGSYANVDENGQINYQFEQPGEILLLANLEWRFGIYRFLKGALFLDAGNVWRIYANPAQPGGEFAVDRFFKEIALGVGYGFRFDFSFIVLRLDAGMKLYDPALPEGSRFVGGSLENYDPFNQNRTLWNISIGYPF